MFGLSVGLIAASASAVAAISAVFVAFAVYRFTRHQHATQMRAQRAIQIHEWTNKSLSVITEAEHFCMLDEACFSTRGAYRIQESNLLHRLSAAIEHGRLFFKNVHQEDYGQEKYPARRGYRPEILDPLVAAYEAVRTNNASHLADWRARFVSLAQFEVDPEWLQEATHYNHFGPGSEAGIPVERHLTEPPPWPEDRRTK